MASQGPLSPSTLASVDRGGTSREWENPSNAASSNNTYATVSGRNATTDWLMARNFGFTIPAGATIDGILVEAELKTTDAATDEVTDVTLWVNRTGAVGTAKTVNEALGTTDAYHDWGGASDDWSAGLGAADINSANFGFAFYITESAANTTKSCDHMRVTVFYTETTQELDAANLGISVTPNAAAIAAEASRTAVNLGISLGLHTPNITYDEFIKGVLLSISMALNTPVSADYAGPKSLPPAVLVDMVSRYKMMDLSARYTLVDAATRYVLKRGDQ